MFNTKPYYSGSYTSNEEISIMSVLELAEYLGVGKNTAYELLRNQTIQGFRIGKTWKVSKDAVDLYIRKNSGLV